ncbi:MAG TPA: NlpC/P60 family protein [Azonexus sp.]|nr:NlpC/P60 family protein [Azonexus sp.]
MRDDIVAAARAEIGTPFRHQGRTPGRALDCAGLMIIIAGRIGSEVIDSTAYARRPSSALLEMALDMQPCLTRVALDAIEPGDILLMKFEGDPQHLAIFAGRSDIYQDDGIIHAWAQARKVCEHRLTPDWRARIVRAYRFAGAA